MTKQPTSDKADFSPRLLDCDADRALDALAEAGNKAPALIEAWIKRGNAAPVVEAAERATGAARKAARRGVNVLKARRVPLPQRPHVTTLAGSKAPPTQQAWLLAPDTAGNVLLVVTSHTPTSRHRAVFVFLHDSAGIRRVDVLEVSQSQLRDAMGRVLPGAEYKPVKVGVEWARARIAAARKRHTETAAPEPLGLTSARDLLEPVPNVFPPHPFDEEGLELSEEDAQSLATNSQLLHNLPEFRGWFPPDHAVNELLAKLGESLTPGEEPDPAFLSERLELEIRAATDRYFAPQRRDDLVRAMRDSALSVLAREGEQKALEVVAAMKVIESAGLITNPPQEVSFLRGFFEKAVSLILAQNQGRLRIPIAKPQSQPLPEPDHGEQPAT